MILIVKLQLAYFTFLLCSLRTTLAVACLGCVDLDEYTFNSTVQRFPYALVKFDIAFPYGPEHLAFGSFARIVYQQNIELMVATVGIKDYGEKENKVLGDRYGFLEKNLPGILLFKQGQFDKPIPMPSHLDVTEANLKLFINENTPYYLGCEGCLKQFNKAINNFANLSNEAQLEVIAQLKELIAQLADEQEQKYGKVYLTFAQKLQTDGYDFIERETKRLVKLKAGRISKEKKAEIMRKLNVLALYRVPKLLKTVTKAEL